MTTYRNAKKINKYLCSDFHSLFFTWVTNLYFSVTCACTKNSLVLPFRAICEPPAIQKLEQAIINMRSISNL